MLSKHPPSIGGVEDKSSARQTEIVEVARTTLGTPFRHQGRAPGIGLDCMGLVVIVCRALNIPHRDQFDYARRPADGLLERAIAENGFLPVHDAPAIGDLMLFHLGHAPQHAAIATELGMIHAFAGARKVVEHGFRSPREAKARD